MVQRSGQQGEGNILFVQNNFYYDAFFLKAIGESSETMLTITLIDVVVLNGACGSGLCTAPNTSIKYHVCLHLVISGLLVLNHTVSHLVLAIRERHTSTLFSTQTAGGRLLQVGIFICCVVFS